MDLYQQGGLLKSKNIDRLAERLATAEVNIKEQQARQKMEPLPDCYYGNIRCI